MVIWAQHQLDFSPSWLITGYLWKTKPETTESFQCFAEMVVELSSATAEEGEVPEPPPLLLVGDLLEWDKIHRLPLVASVSPQSMVAIKNHQKHGHNDPPLVFPPVDHENLHISPDPPPTPNQIPHIHAGNQRISFSDSDSDSDSNSSSTFSPSDSSPVLRSPIFSNPRARPTADAAGWFDFWSEILNSKVNVLVRFFCSTFTSARGVFLTFRSPAFTAILILFLYFRRRRRLRCGEESRDRLIGIIKERDEVGWGNLLSNCLWKWPYKQKIAILHEFHYCTIIKIIPLQFVLQKINQLLDQISRMNQVLLALHKVPTP